MNVTIAKTARFVKIVVRVVAANIVMIAWIAQMHINARVVNI